MNAQVDRLVESYASRLEQQGISLEMYMQYMAMTADKLRDDLKEPAVTQIKQQLALDAVVAAEGITISDEEVDEEVKKAAANLNVPYEQVIEGLDKEPLKVDLARDKAMALVAAEGKPHLVAAEDDGDIKVTEVTKDDVQEESNRRGSPRRGETQEAYHSDQEDRGGRRGRGREEACCQKTQSQEDHRRGGGSPQENHHPQKEGRGAQG